MSQPLEQDANTLAHNLLCEAGQRACNKWEASANAYLYGLTDRADQFLTRRSVGHLLLFDLLILSTVVFTAVHVFLYICHQIVWCIRV